MFKSEAPLCPRTAVVDQFSSLTRFAPGPDRDLLDINFQAQIADLVAGCEYRTKDDGKTTVTVAVAPVLVAIKGPANTDQKANFSYFVSAVTRDQTILNKQIFDVSMDFTGNRERVVQRDDDPPISVDIELPNIKAALQYEILIGLQLTPDELAYNQSRRPVPR